MEHIPSEANVNIKGTPEVEALPVDALGIWDIDRVRARPRPSNSSNGQIDPYDGLVRPSCSWGGSNVRGTRDRWGSFKNDTGVKEMMIGVGNG